MLEDAISWGTYPDSPRLKLLLRSPALEEAERWIAARPRKNQWIGRDVAYWPIATNFSLGPDVSFRGEAEMGRAAEFAASVENDPSETFEPY